MNRLKIYLFIIAAGCSVASFAQDLNPTVEVTRQYQGQINDADKPAVDMFVPDSLYQFDVSFDYSVFDNPYKGSYEFNPYMIKLNPQPSDQRNKTFYLRAGAGYPVYPTLDVVWSPILKNNFNLDVYGVHRSYVGNYRTFNLPSEGGQLGLSFDENGKRVFQEGYDLLTRTGVDGRWDWKNGKLSFDVGYYGLAQKDMTMKRGYDALDVNFLIASKKWQPGSFYYSFGVDYRFAEDKLVNASAPEHAWVGEHDLKCEVVLGGIFKNNHKFFIDADLEFASYNGELQGTYASVSATPRYHYEKDKYDIDLGVNISYLTSNVMQLRQQIVYPDVMIRLNAIKDAMQIYVSVSGGAKLKTYSSLLSDNHFITPYFTRGAGPLMGVSYERLRAVLGFEGRITSVFAYNLRGGFVNVGSDMMDRIMPNVMPAVTYGNYQKAFAALDWNLNLEYLKFDGSVAYNHVWTGVFEPGLNNGILKPAAFTGNCLIEYNWHKRIFVGLDCDFATSRSTNIVTSENKSIPVTINGFADLGFNFEYATPWNLSFWLRAGNLLHMSVYKNPFYVEQGVNLTAGICLNL